MSNSHCGLKCPIPTVESPQMNTRLDVQHFTRFHFTILNVTKHIFNVSFDTEHLSQGFDIHFPHRFVLFIRYQLMVLCFHICSLLEQIYATHIYFLFFQYRCFSTHYLRHCSKCKWRSTSLTRIRNKEFHRKFFDQHEFWHVSVHTELVMADINGRPNNHKHADNRSDIE